MKKAKPKIKISDRKLGDEWLNWDGTDGTESTDTGYRVFLGMAVISIIVIISMAGLFLWLIYPRLISTGTFIPQLFSILYLIFSGILTIWLVLFVIAAMAKLPISKHIIIPSLVNWLLDIVMWIGRFLGFSKDRLTNSFLKIHNMIIGAGPSKTRPEKLLLLLPRCLTKEVNKALRGLRDKYGFQMVTVGGGTDARKKIHEIHPEIIIAIACERDLMSGFREVNVHTPVIGFPNQRPEGPCKNTCVDLIEIEGAIKNCLIEIPDKPVSTL